MLMDISFRSTILSRPNKAGLKCDGQWQNMAQSERSSCGDLFRLRRVANQMSSVLDELSWNRRVAKDPARSFTQQVK